MLTERTGLVLRRPSPSATVDAIVRAEQRGLRATWATVGGTAPDALTLFAAAAARTERITFGTAIVPTYPRHPIVLASQALVLADLAPGRIRIGVGPSHRPIIEGMFGIPFTRPHAQVREYVAVLRRLLWEGVGDVNGSFFTIRGAALPAGTSPPRIPLLISALRANGFHLAGEVADGAISWMCPIPYLTDTALPALQQGASEAARSVPPLIAHVPVALHRDREAVRAAAHSQIGSYGRLPFYAQMFRDAGYPPADDGTLPDALLDSLVVSGAGEEVAERLSTILDAGIAEVLLTLVTVADPDAEELALIDAVTRQ